MNASRSIAQTLGALYLMAMMASLTGGIMIESLLQATDLHAALEEGTAVAWTAISLEFVNSICVGLIAVLMYDVLVPFGRSIALVFIGFRILEALFCVAAAFVPAALLSFVLENPIDLAAFDGYLLSVRSMLTGLLIPVSFALGAMAGYYLLFRSRLVPPFIAIWGFVGTVLILLLNVMKPEGAMAMVLALPTILNEIFLGIWLIARGFNRSSATR